MKVGWIVGDSRAASWPKTMLPEVYFWENICRNGFTTLETLDCLRQNMAISGVPEVLVVQCGVNDVKAAGFHPDQLENFLEAARKNLTNLVRQVDPHEECQVILTTILPHGPLELRYRLFWTDALDQTIVSLNQHIKSLAGSRVLVVDSFKAMETERFLGIPTPKTPCI